MGEAMANYKVFYTDRPVPAGTQPDLSFTLPRIFMTRDEALNYAFKLIHSGAMVWKIEGPDGFRLDQAEIEKQYRTIVKSS
jgi:hypothetical protein